MNNYIPLLKVKNGEFSAIKSLDAGIKNKITPFLELPFSKMANASWLKNKMPKIRRKIELNLDGISSFYFDNYNINSDLMIDGVVNNYEYTLNVLKNMPVIPVVSIDRHPEYNQSVFKLRQQGEINSTVLAIRFTKESFLNYHLVAAEIKNELGHLISLFDQVDLIMDCRVCLKHDVDELSTYIKSFATNFSNNYIVRRVVVAGSSIPPSIADLLKPESDVIVNRKELTIYRNVQSNSWDFELYLGDYGSVSPEFSEIDIIPEAMRNVTAPKIIYSYGDSHYIMRGGALASHYRGADQYNDMLDYLVKRPFFRGPQYSEGGRFFEEKARSVGKGVTPASIVNPTLNAHITFMMKGWS